MDRVNSNESLVDLWGGGGNDNDGPSPNKNRSDCTNTTYEGSEESGMSPHEIARKEYGNSFTRRSLVDRARVFDKNFHDSFDEKMFQTLTDEGLTDAERKMQEKEFYKFGNMSQPLPGAHHFVSPTLSKEQRESFESKAKRNLKIYLPKGYDTDAELSYPVAIILGDDYLFDYMLEMQSYLQM